MPAHNATRERLLQARDAFRASVNENHVAAPQESQPAPEPQPQVQQPLAQQQQIQQPAAELRPVNEITPPSGFEDALRNMGAAQQPVTPPAANGLTKAQEENARLLKEVEELRKARESDKAMLDEYNKLKEQQELDKYLNGTEQLSSISADDARKLLSPVLRSVRTENENMRAQIAKDRADLDKRFSELDKREQAMNERRTYDAIMKAHPDLAEIQKSKAYSDIMTSPIGSGSGMNIGTMVAVELKRGNSEYVINVLNEVKKRMSTPDLASMATVSSSAPSVGTPAPDTSGDILTDAQIAELRYQMQTKQISREEFREKIQKHREASRLRR